MQINITLNTKQDGNKNHSVFQKLLIMLKSNILWVVKHAPRNKIFSQGVKALNAFTVISTCTQSDIISCTHANWHVSDVIF